MAYELAPLVQARDNVIRVQHPNIEGSTKTYIGTAIAASGTALTVRDTAGFAQNDYVLAGKYGSDQAEIVRITAAFSAGPSLPVSAVTFAHPIDTPITKVLWNRIEIVGNATNTTTGATSIVTTAITPSEDYTEYVNTGTTYAFYFVRYNNEQTAANSSYSDGVRQTGYLENTRARVKQRVDRHG